MTLSSKVSRPIYDAAAAKSQIAMPPDLSHKRLPPSRNASMVAWATQSREANMAKGQMKSNKEAKKPKADKEKGAGSSYKQSQGSTLSATTETFKKKK
jgi:hypothetical protein